MKRNLIHNGLSLLIVAAALLGVGAPAQAQDKKPNILFIMGDDIGWMQPSCYHRGLMVGETPNIDRIAKEGAIMMTYYAEQSCTAARPTCGPERRLSPRSSTIWATAPASSARTTSATIPTRYRPRTGSRSSGGTSITWMRCRV